MTKPLLVNVAELLRNIGAIREVDCQLDVAEFNFEDTRIVKDSPIDVELTLASLSNGIVVTGSLGVDWVGECRRCLRPIASREIVELQELYQVVLTDQDAYQIVADQIDLLEMARETMLLGIPQSPLCRADCPGLCLQCGADLQAGNCGCIKVVGDNRWAVLDALRKDN